jgi:hypothetical protein
MTEPARHKPATRSRADDPLLREVRWRLFSREELPARLRRLERLEEVAFKSRPDANGAAAEKDEDDR